MIINQQARKTAEVSFPSEFLLSLYLFIYYYYFLLSLVFIFLTNKLIYLFILGHVGSSLRCVGFSLQWLLLLWSMGSRCVGFSSCGTQAQ